MYVYISDNAKIRQLSLQIYGISLIRDRFFPIFYTFAVEI